MNQSLPAILGFLLAITPAAQAQFNYTSTNGTITITGYTGSGGAVAIPATINGLPVTSIGDAAFAYTYVESVTIPASVTNIGSVAFGDCSLTNMTIPASVIHIGDQAFSHCFGLSAINVNAYNLSYSSVNGVLFDKNLTTLLQYPIAREGSSYTIFNSVTSIGDLAFADSSISQVSTGNAVTNIGWGAFQYCQSLTNITIPAGVGSIGARAFDSCASLSAINVNAGNLSYSSVDGVLFDKNQAMLLQYPIARLGSFYTIPNGVTNIGMGAFAGSTLTGITIPGSVISLPYIEYEIQAFIGCANLIAINVDATNPAYSSIDGVLFDKSQTMLLQCPGGKPGHYTIPAGVTNIGSDAFNGCSLTDVTIPGSVTIIGSYAFADSAKLTNVFFEGNAPSTGMDIFFGDIVNFVYYLPGTTGWNAYFGPYPTALWLPQAQTGDGSFGVRANQFGFNINWTGGQTVVVEACTNLTNPHWSSVVTNTLSSDSVYFSDSQWTNYPARFYRLRSP